MRMNKVLVGLALGTLLSCGMDATRTDKGVEVGEEDQVEDSAETDTASEEVTDQTEDSGNENDEIEENVESGDPKPLTDFLQVGPYDITVNDRTASVTDCSSMSYRVYTPSVGDPPVVVLGHGFGRGSDVMVGWAEHLASWGIEVLLPTLCHYNVFFGVDHEMNGQNMIELANLHGSEDVVYAGHSAGGLAAIIAAAQDIDAIGVLGLDTTDTEDTPGVEDYIGRNFAGGITVPTFFIMGEPSSCNSENNGLDLFRMTADYQAVKVVDSDHCDFENPTNSICELSCENSSSMFEDTEVRSVILTLGTAAIISLTNLSEDGSLIWETGLESWISSGLVDSIE